MFDFTENKYSRWYFAIIQKGHDSSGYVEEHHIFPKSLGGSKEKENLIQVSARKHFLLHWLLTKFTQGSDLHKMQRAFGVRMSILKKKRNLTSGN